MTANEFLDTVIQEVSSLKLAPNFNVEDMRGHPGWGQTVRFLHKEHKQNAVGVTIYDDATVHLEWGKANTIFPDITYGVGMLEDPGTLPTLLNGSGRLKGLIYYLGRLD